MKFRLFETQINGGEVETCEAMVNGVPFSDANTAGQFNAGIDIINAICRFEGISAPIFADGSESVNTLHPTQSQVIRLFVSLDDKARHQAQRKSGSTEEPFRLIIIHLKFNAIMKTEEQKSAFILRVEEMVKEIETLMQEGGNERSCILLVNEKPQDSDMTAQCIAIMGSGKRLIESMAAFIERPNMAEVVSLSAKLAALKKLAEN